tara:strand:+ start:202 stop:624 length:423 start_codon:yes stop_codon:yes gene_type:complete
MTQQVFTVGQEVIRVASSTPNITQGCTYDVSFVHKSGSWLQVVGYEDCLDACKFRPASNIKPIPTEDTPMQDIEINELRNSIVALETELGETKAELAKMNQWWDDTKEELAKMNQWWYEEKTKGEALKELVVKQATQMMA